MLQLASTPEQPSPIPGCERLERSHRPQRPLALAQTGFGAHWPKRPLAPAPTGPGAHWPWCQLAPAPTGTGAHWPRRKSTQFTCKTSVKRELHIIVDVDRDASGHEYREKSCAEKWPSPAGATQQVLVALESKRLAPTATRATSSQPWISCRIAHGLPDYFRYHSFLHGSQLRSLSRKI